MTKEPKIIRSTKVTLKLSNLHKKEQLIFLQTEYLYVTQKFVDIIWNSYGLTKPIPKRLPKEITSQMKTTWLSARMIQACAKQASGIVRGTIDKHKKRLFKLNQLNQEGKFKHARKLQAFINKHPVSKPILKTLEMELDSRFFEIKYSPDKKIDGWIVIKSLRKKITKLILPFQCHKHLNELRKSGKQTGSIRLSANSCSFSFELVKPENKENKTLGIDIGMNTCFSCSDGNCCNTKVNGHDIESVCKILSRKKKGSKAYKRTIKHRSNLIGFYKNQINWDIKTLKLENIRNLRKGKKTSRYLSNFVYGEIFDMLEQTAERKNVSVVHVNPTYTSQRCSHCGWTRKCNRNGKTFKCSTCGYTADADFNASVNISLDLPVISKVERLKRPNLVGFYWQEKVPLGQASIVPVVR